MKMLILVGTAFIPLAACAQAHEPKEAEFAIRWAPADGGPQTPAEVLKLLGTPDAQPVNYEVRYFDEPGALAVPESTEVIIRLRSMHDGKSEVRLKYRRAAPWPAGWKCPAAMHFERSEQVDVTFLDAGKQVRTYTYSCTIDLAEPPPALHAVAKNCSAFMVRYEAKRARLEEWVLPGGQVVLEVSHAADNTAAELAKFKVIADTLVAHRANPSALSKTKLASDCPAASS
jgi:hypothetical protein